MRKPRSTQSKLQRRIARLVASAFTGGGAILLGNVAPAAAQARCLPDVLPSFEVAGFDSSRVETISVHVDPFRVQPPRHGGTGHMTVQLRIKDEKYGAEIQQWLASSQHPKGKAAGKKVSLVLLNLDGGEARRWVFEGTQLESLATSSLHLTNGEAGTSADGLTELSLAFDSFADIPGQEPSTTGGDPSLPRFAVSIGAKPSAGNPPDTTFSSVTGGGDPVAKGPGRPTPVVLDSCLTSGRGPFADWLADSLAARPNSPASQRAVTITALERGKAIRTNLYFDCLIEEYTFPELSSHDHNTLKEKVTIRPERHEIQ